MFDPGPMGCTGCPDNLLLIHGSPGQFDQLNLIGARLGAAWSVCARSRGVAG